MNTGAAFWFLVAIGTGQYIGPFNENTCKMAAVTLNDSGVACKPAVGMQVCDAAGRRPGTFTTCPVFDFPQVTVR